MKKYKYTSVVTMGDTNVFHNMYFSNYFKLQGICRELFVVECLNDYNILLSQGMSLVTKQAEMNFIKDFHLFEHLIVELDIASFGDNYAELRFEFYEKSSRELRAEGKQKILFIDINNIPCKIPDDIITTLMEYKTENSQEVPND